MVLEFARDIFRPNDAATIDDTRSWVDPLGHRLSDRVWIARQEVRRQIDKTLTTAIATGESPLLTARKLEQYLSPSWAPQRNERGRLVANQPKRIVTRTPNAGAGSYPARRLARTEITRAFGAATVKAAEMNPFVDGVRWATSGRHRGSDVCDDNASGHSRGMDRGEYRTDEVPSYPGHPQCRCVLSPVVARESASVVAQLRRDYGLDPQPVRLLELPSRGRARDLVTALFRAARMLVGREAA